MWQRPALSSSAEEEEQTEEDLFLTIAILTGSPARPQEEIWDSQTAGSTFLCRKTGLLHFVVQYHILTLHHALVTVSV